MKIFATALAWICFQTATTLQVFSDENQTIGIKIENYAYTPLSFSNRIHELKLSETDNGIYQIETTGTDPYVWLQSFKDAYQSNLSYIIAFEYQVAGDFGEFVFYYSTGNQTKAIRTKLKPSEDWKWHVFELSEKGKLIGQEIDDLRMDFGEQANKTFQVKNLRLIETTRDLRLYASVGDKLNQIKDFGIGLNKLNPQFSAAETVRHVDDKSSSVTLSVYRYLDLDAQTKSLSKEGSTRPPVPLGPQIVAGEGPAPQNHTIIRILSEYQVCETQFLAYPPTIRGGVGVETGKDEKDHTFIATWPLLSKLTHNIHLFNQGGGTIGKIQVPKEIPPPFDLAVGNFAPGSPGDEIAVISQNAQRAKPIVLVYSSSGRLLSRKTINGEKGRYALITKGKDRLIAQEFDENKIHTIFPAQKESMLDIEIQSWSLFDSVYPDRDFNGGKSEKTTSTLMRFTKSKEPVCLDAGRMENKFWFDPQEEHNGDPSTWEKFPDGKYVSNGLYNYLGSAQYWSPLIKSGKIESKSYEEWTSKIDWSKVTRAPAWRKSIENYNQGKPTVWTAAFTHRWSVGKMKSISSKIDSKTGLPTYLLLDRKNDPSGGGYFGKTLFDYGSQHFENEALNKLYTYAQRAFYRKLAPVYRKNPEMTIAVEPNHENEIVSGSDSIGDYNIGSLKGFYHYLSSLYGDIESINQIMGTSFTTDFFDAPRNLYRGNWDKYDFENLFFREWVEYNRVLVSRRVGTSYRECLLAGFPPEMIKSHQIPDSYVFKSIVGISEGEKRISPIDWLLTTGAGFGFSRYGTYYDREHNIGQGAYSSGFDNMLVGEYASLNASHEKSLNQLLYLRNHGVSTLHVMWWPSELDKGFNKSQGSALREMISNHDTPRKGLAGGISEIRPWRGKDQSFDIASLGTGPSHTGLLKSLKKDGSFEGTVYTVPFHAHVNIEVMNEQKKTNLNPRPKELATILHTRPGSVIEVSFKVNGKTDNLLIDFTHRGVKLSDKSIRLEQIKAGQQVRLVYKIPLLMDEIKLLASTDKNIEIEDFLVVHHQDQVINLAKKIMTGKRHQGGVTFAYLPQ
jgi:hypothetical protein